MISWSRIAKVLAAVAALGLPGLAAPAQEPVAERSGEVFLVGQVLGANGEPLAEAEVDVRWGHVLPERILAAGRSDRSGRWRLGPVPGRWPGPEREESQTPPWRLRFRAAGHAETIVEQPARAIGTVVEIPPQRLESDLQLSGRVAGLDGHGIGGAEIWVWPAAAGRRMWSGRPADEPRGKSGADGRFVLGGTAAGEAADLEVRAAGFVPRIWRGFPAGKSGLELKLGRAARFEAQVLDVGGEPVPFVHVCLQAPLPRESEDEQDYFDGSTDQQGLASLDVRPGRSKLHVQAPGFLEYEQSLEIGEGASREVVRLPRGNYVDITVFDESGARASGAWITLGGRQGGFPGVTDTHGFFRVGNLAPGKQVLAASNRVSAGEGAIEVRPGQASYRLDLRLNRPIYRVYGSVVDAAGKPLDRQSVLLRLLPQAPGDEAGAIWASALTYADGSFHFELALGGSFVAEVYPEGRGAASSKPLLTQEIAVPRDAPLQLALPRQP